MSRVRLLPNARVALNYMMGVYNDPSTREYQEIDIPFLEKLVARMKLRARDFAPGRDADSRLSPNRPQYVDPEEKMSINDLTKITRRILNVGLLYYDDVDKLVKAQIKANGGREDGIKDLTRYFRNAFNKVIRERGVWGDELFDDLIEELNLHQGVSGKNYLTIVAMITYFFLKCDIFCRTEEEAQRAREQEE